MPNSAQRITDTTVQAMTSMFFMFNSLDECIDITLHPKYHIVINDFSRYGENYDPETVEKDPTSASMSQDQELSPENRIFAIRCQLIKCANNLYNFKEISDATKIGKKMWKEIRNEVCSGHSYKENPWFVNLTEHQKTLLNDLENIQRDVGIQKPIEP